MAELPDVKAFIDDLGSGHASVEAVRSLRDGQVRKRVFLLELLVSLAGRRHSDAAAASLLGEAHTYLADLQQQQPALVRRLIAAPESGAWLGHCLRRLRDPEPDRAAGPLWPDLGYLGWLAAAASIRAGRRATHRIVVRGGTVLLPGIGSASVSDERDGWADAESRGDGRFAIRFARTTVPGGPEVSRDADPGWYPSRGLGDFRGRGHRVQVDDIDPFRDAVTDPSAPARSAARLTPDEYELWDSRFTAARGLLARKLPATAAAVDEWLWSIRPIDSGDSHITVSDTSPDAFGRMEASLPEDAHGLARTLVHEFQHAALGALTDVVTLVVPSSRLFYAPWRDELRPADKLLQGAFAHIGVAACERVFSSDDDASPRSGTPSPAREEHTGHRQLRGQIVLCLRELRGSGVLTAEGEVFVDRLLASRELSPPPPGTARGFARPGAGALPPAQTSRLLPAYFDLFSGGGPLHNRAVADLGRRLRAGRPLPAYQVLSPVWLRAAVERDCPQFPSLSDPRDLPGRARSPQWRFLCRRLERWESLDAPRQFESAFVLAKLGFWRSMARLPVSHDVTGAAPASRRLAYLHCTALLNTRGTDPDSAADAYRILAELAEETGLPIASRLSAAVNLIALHARSRQPRAATRAWYRLAGGLIDAATPHECSDLLVSAYWRAASFVPFFDGDHDATLAMLERAAAYARRGLREAGEDRRLLAAETLSLVLDTWSRAAEAAGDAELALRCCRALVAADPLDAKAQVRLADCRLAKGDVDGAQRAYNRAVALGAPYTDYATAQYGKLDGSGRIPA